MSYNSKLIEIHPINKLMKLSKSLCTFTLLAALLLQSVTCSYISVVVLETGLPFPNLPTGPSKV